MENRKYVKRTASLALFVFSLAGLFPFFSFAYHGKTTHPAFTREIVNFYNLSYVKKISEGEKQLILRGNASEDAAMYVLKQKYESDSLWAQALSDYAKEDEKQAFLELGRILYVIEDASVRNHTWNSLLENWTETFGFPASSLADALYEKRYEPIIRNSLEEYIDEAAGYSNRYFFSEDAPSRIVQERIEVAKDGRKERYGYGIDEEGREFKLVLLLDAPHWRRFDGKRVSTLNSERIFADYWERFSRRAVLGGAGTVRLFLEEAKIARALYRKELAREKEKRIMERIAGFFSFSSLLKNPSALAKAVKKEKETISRYPILGRPSQNVSQKLKVKNQKYSVKAKTEIKDSDIDHDDEEDERFEQSLIFQNESSKPKTSHFQEKIVNIGPKQIPIRQPADQNLKQGVEKEFEIQPQIQQGIPQGTATAIGGGSFGYYREGDIRFSEIAWMGTAENANYEWIELENTTDKEISLEGFTLIKGEGSLLVGDKGDEFLSRHTISPRGFFLLERDESAVSMRADKLYDGSLSNSGERLILKDGNNNEIDKIEMAEGWQAGSNEIQGEGYKPTMSSIGGMWGNGEPTPKTQNREYRIENKEKDVPLQLQLYPPQSIVISEIAWMGDSRSPNNEWIELFNNASSTISLSGWTLEAEDGSPNISLSGSFSPNTYFLLERTDDDTVPEVSADLLYTGSLENKGEAMVLKNSEGNEIDRVSNWYAGDNDAKQTMQKDNLILEGTEPTNWFTAMPTPKTVNQRDPEFSSPPLPPSPPTHSSYNFHDVVINEIAWMGTLTSSQDEWLELKNATSDTVNLVKWKLVFSSNASSTPEFTIDFADGDSIPAKSFFVLERNSTSTIQIIKGNVYSGSASQMANGGEYLVLRDGSDIIIDVVDGTADWKMGTTEIKGSNSDKRSMERSSTDLSLWYTFNKAESRMGGDSIIDREGNSIRGTPGCENSEESGTCAF